MNKFKTLKLLVKSAKLVEHAQVHNYARDNEEVKENLTKVIKQYNEIKND